MKSPTTTEVMTSDAVAGALIFVDPNADRKRLATIRAELAIKGFVLRKQVDGTFLISKWDYCREVTSIDAAARFLEQICGAR
jgi:hypothetical protein